MAKAKTKTKTKTKTEKTSYPILAFAIALFLKNRQNKDIFVGVHPQKVLMKLSQEILVIPEKSN